MIERNRIFVALAAVLSCGLWACGGGGDGAAEGGGFESADGFFFGGDRFGSPSGGDGTAVAGAGGAAAGEPTTPDISNEPREVEESDIYRFDGDRLYVLNQYRGLFVIDVSDPDAPAELGRVDLFGQPEEMYVRGDRVFAILRDYLEPYESDDLPDDTLRRVYSSRIVALDVSDPKSPKSLGDFALDGSIIDSRLVGDVIYAAAGVDDPTDDLFADGCNGGPGLVGTGGAVAVGGAAGVGGGPAPVGTPAGFYGPDQRMVVTSVDVSDPADPREIDQLEIDAGGLFVHATDQAFVIAGPDYSSASGPQTLVTYVDISDPTGEMTARGGLTLSGEIQDDTALHMYEGQLRVLTRDWSRGLTKVRIFDAGDPDACPCSASSTTSTRATSSARRSTATGST